MLGLTVWQPWASLIAWPLKPIENRTWKRDSLLGQRIAIHAGNKYDEDAALHLSVRPRPVPDVCRLARHVRGAIVCTAVVDRFVDDEFAELVFEPPGMTGAQFDAIQEWYAGPVGWVLRDVRRFEPVPCRGAQGLWTVTAEVLARIPEAGR